MSDRDAVKKLIALLKGYRKAIAVIFGCLIISSVLNLYIPLLNRRIMDDGFIGGNRLLIIKLAVVSLILHLLSFAIDIIKEKRRIDISAKMKYVLSEKSFLHLIKMKTSYFDDKSCAEILNNINTDIEQMTSIADEGAFFVVTEIFNIIGGIIGLFILDYRMTFLVLLFIPVKFGAMQYFAERRKQVMNEFILNSQRYAGWFEDTFGGIKEVKLFGIFENKYQEFVDKRSRVIRKQQEMNMISQENLIADRALIYLLITLIYVIGANLVFNLQLSIGSVFAFITYSAYVTDPISSILNIGYLLAGIIPSAKRYYEFMEVEEENDYCDTPVPEFGDLKLENIHFAYESGKSVLINVNLNFPVRSKTAIIGKNGAGKTTIVNLLTRLYEPACGRILLNGTDVLGSPLHGYRELVSVVSQQIYLFHDTIRNNICLYKNVSDEAIEAACQDSGLMEFIREVSLDYVVGQNGAMLSGGQKQKIALARALIYDKPIVILDEATSNADIFSEQQINGLLHTRLKDKTVIVITHQKKIMKEVDQIIALNDGTTENIEYSNELLEQCL